MFMFGKMATNTRVNGFRILDTVMVAIFLITEIYMLANMFMANRKDLVSING